MIRVAGLHDQVDAGLTEPGADGRTPAETIDAIARARRRARASARRAAWSASCCPRWPSTGSGSVAATSSTDAQRAALAERFRRQIFPVLTPLAVGLGRPFPYISNLSLSLAVLVRDPGRRAHRRSRASRCRRRCCRGSWRSSGDEHDVRPARGGDRRQPRRAVPGHGDRRPRRLPRHARRRLRGLRRGRRPAAAPSRPSCAAGASARSCASRSTPG